MKIGIHMLIPYPPSNPNRGELGEPKTAIVGGKLRQRISSQAMKRAWRLSETMQQLDAGFSRRTRRLGVEVIGWAEQAGMASDEALKVGAWISSAFGKTYVTTELYEAMSLPDKDKRFAKPSRGATRESATTAEVVVIGHEEWAAAKALAEACAQEGRMPTDDELSGLQRDTASLDVALFGRMRAKTPRLNVDASCAVAHALTTDRVTIESDFWTAVDDLNRHDSDSGAGGMDEREFGSGCYYVYAMIDYPRLVENLLGDQELAGSAVLALVETMCTSQPGGHRSSFANFVNPAFLRIETGPRVVGSMMLPAFEAPVTLTQDAIETLRDAAASYASAYGLEPAVAEMSVPHREGSLPGVLAALAVSLEAFEAQA